MPSPETNQEQQNAKAKSHGRRALSHEMLLNPNLQNAAAAQSWGDYAGEVNLQDFFDGLQSKVKQLKNGDTSDLEQMLFGQALALQTIFTCLARKAKEQDRLGHFETLLSLALKAQNQSRKTIQSLSDVKSFKISVVGQANITSGPQQINNCSQGYCEINSKNKLEEVRNGQRLE